MAAKPKVYRLTGRPAVYDLTGKPAVFIARGASPRTGLGEGFGTVEGVGSPEVATRKTALASVVFEGIGSQTLQVLNRDLKAEGVGAPYSEVSTQRFVSASVEGVGIPAASAKKTALASLAAEGVGQPAVSILTNPTFLQMIEAIGADSGLDFCLDAAAAASWPGSGQTWFDLTGNGHNFFRGSSGSSQGSDPTFNGVAGALSENEYFSCDGGDFFRETAAHTFAEPWHKDNGAFTVAGVVLMPGPAGGNDAATVFSSTIGTANGVNLVLSRTGGELFTSIFVGSGGFAVLNAAHNFGDTVFGAPIFFAFALDEATGADGLTFQINTTRVKATSTYPSAGVSGSSAAYQIAATGGNEAPSGTRFYCNAAWSRRLTDDELDDLYSQLQTRFSALP